MAEKVDNIDTTGFVLKTTYDTDKSDLEKTLLMEIKKIPDTSDLAKKIDLNAKISEIENKIPSITDLATNSALTAVENKIPDVRSLVKKTDYNTKRNEVEKKASDHNHDKYITTPELNRLTTENFKARVAQADLVTKTNFVTKLQDISKRVTSNKTKHLLAENERKKLKAFDMDYFRGRNFFEGNDGVQNTLVFQLISKYLKTINGNITVSEWKSKGISNEVLQANNTPAPQASAPGRNMYLKFNRSCLKIVKNLTYVFKGPMAFNAVIVYSLSSNLNNFNFTLENCLFGANRLVKNADIDKYKYLGYGIGFDARAAFYFLMEVLLKI